MNEISCARSPLVRSWDTLRWVALFLTVIPMAPMVAPGQTNDPVKATVTVELDEIGCVDEEGKVVVKVNYEVTDMEGGIDYDNFRWSTQVVDDTYEEDWVEEQDDFESADGTAEMTVTLKKETGGSEEEGEAGWGSVTREWWVDYQLPGETTWNKMDETVIRIEVPECEECECEDDSCESESDTETDDGDDEPPSTDLDLSGGGGGGSQQDEGQEAPGAPLWMHHMGRLGDNSRNSASLSFNPSFMPDPSGGGASGSSPQWLRWTGGSNVQRGSFQPPNTSGVYSHWFKTGTAYTEIADDGQGNVDEGYYIKTYDFSQIEDVGTDDWRPISGATPYSVTHVYGNGTVTEGGRTYRRLRFVEEDGIAREFLYSEPDWGAVPVNAKVWELRERESAATMPSNYFENVNDLLRRVRVTTEAENSTDYRVTREVYWYDTVAQTEKLIKKTEELKEDFGSYGWRIGERVVHTDGGTETTTYDYYTYGRDKGRLKSYDGPDGGWAHYTYDATTGRVSRRYGPAPLSGSSKGASTTSNRYSDYKYNQTNYDVRRIDYVDGNVVGVTYTVVNDTAHTVKTVRCGSLPTNLENPDSAQDALVTTVEQFPHTSSVNDGRTKKVTYPDGTVSIYSYAGEVTDSDVSATMKLLKTTHQRGHDAGNGTVDEGIETVTWRTAAGHVVKREVKDIDSGIMIADEHVVASSGLDEFGRPTVWNNNLTSQDKYIEFGCCGKESVIDYDGLTTKYSYNKLRHVTGIEKGYWDLLGPGDPNQDVFTTISKFVYVVDALGRRVETIQVSQPSEATVTVSERVYDLGGSLKSETDALGNTTQYKLEHSYDDPRRIRALPQSGTPAAYRNTVDWGWDDGSPRLSWTYAASTALSAPTSSASGGTLEKIWYEYNHAETNWSGYSVKRLSDGDVPTTTYWTKTFYDLLGRKRKVVYPDSAEEVWTYADDTGQLASYTDADGVTTFYGYDSQGRRDLVVLDLDGDGTFDDIDPGGGGDVDRITKTTRYFHSLGADRQAVRTDVSSDDGKSLVMAGIRHSKVHGYGRFDVRDSQSTTTEMVGTTTTGVIADPPVLPNTSSSAAPPGYWANIVTDPAGVVTTRYYSNGRLSKLEVVDTDDDMIRQETYTYDGMGRLASSTDARTGTTDFTYYDNGRRKEVKAPPPSGSGSKLVTEYTYDAVGNVTAIELPDGTTQNRQYWSTGRLKQTSGSQAYTVDYEYDPYGGRMVSMTTSYGNGMGAGTSETTWEYDTGRGWLVEKEYPGGDSTTYDYTGGGRLAERVRARDVTGSMVQVTTDYSYNPAGQLLAVDHNDGTPDVLFQYTLNGQKKVVTDGEITWNMGDPSIASADKRFVYEYAYASSYPYRLEEEVFNEYDGGTLQRSRELDRLYEPAAGVDNRYKGFELNNLDTSTEDHENLYTYDEAGRLKTVADLNNKTGGYGAFTYKYNVSGGSSTSYGNLTGGYSNDSIDVGLTYEAGRNGIASVSNNEKIGYTEVSNFLYEYNSLGQRTDMEYSGTAFSASGGYDYFYNSRGELGASDFTGTGNTNNRSYTYDAIGNRVWSAEGGTVEGEAPEPSDPKPAGATGTDYTANSDNQYTAITGTSPSPDHDKDGNLVSDDTFAYEWDAENRLVVAEPISPVSGDKRMECEYDYRGRRVIRRLLSYTSTTATTPYNELLFVYDGWNPVAVYNIVPGNPEVLAFTYTWGLDLSGTLHGAGGVGGLLAQEKIDGSPGNVVSLAMSDANGNIWQYINADTGTILGKYEYDAFGNENLTGGVYHWMHYIRFSSKWLEKDVLKATGSKALGLSYYGYRYYGAETGRWLNRDPIAENGGLNLYGFIQNDGINFVDKLGLERDYSCCTKTKIAAVGNWLDKEWPKVKKRIPNECPQGESCYNYASVGAQLLNLELLKAKKSCWSCGADRYSKTDPTGHPRDEETGHVILPETKKNGWQRFFGGHESWDDHWVIKCNAVGIDGKDSGDSRLFDATGDYTGDESRLNTDFPFTGFDHDGSCPAFPCR